MKAFSSVLMVALVLTGYGCNADTDRGAATHSPNPILAPSPIVSPGPAVPDRSAQVEMWRLTTRIVALEGTACFFTEPVGAEFDDWTLSVERNEAQVRLVYDVNNPHDNLLFVGDLNEQSFTAVSNTYRTGWQCAPNVTFSSSVIGSFSSDRRTLSGRERLTYRVDGGSDLIITFEWNATRF